MIAWSWCSVTSTGSLPPAPVPPEPAGGLGFGLQGEFGGEEAVGLGHGGLGAVLNVGHEKATVGARHLGTVHVVNTLAVYEK